MNLPGPTVGVDKGAHGADTDAVRHAAAWRDDLDDQVTRLRRQLDADLATAAGRCTAARFALPHPTVLDDLDRDCRESRQLSAWMRAVATGFDQADRCIQPMSPDPADPVRNRLPTADQQRAWDLGSAAAAAVHRALDAMDEEAADQALLAIADLDGPAREAAFERLGDLGQIEQRLVAAARDMPPWWRFGDGVIDAVTGTVAGVAMLGRAAVDAETRQAVWSGVRHLATNPSEIPGVVVDVDGFRRDPWHWAGGLVPSVAAAGVARAGTATARATTGAALANVRNAVGPVARIRALRELRAVSVGGSVRATSRAVTGLGQRAATVEDVDRAQRVNAVLDGASSDPAHHSTPGNRPGAGSGEQGPG